MYRSISVADRIPDDQASVGSPVTRTIPEWLWVGGDRTSSHVR